MLLLYSAGTVANCEIRDSILLAVQMFPALGQAGLRDEHTLFSPDAFCWYLLFYSSISS